MKLFLQKMPDGTIFLSEKRLRPVYLEGAVCIGQTFVSLYDDLGNQINENPEPSDEERDKLEKDDAPGHGYWEVGDIP